MIERKALVKVMALTVLAVVGLSLVTYEKIDARNYVAYIRVENRTPVTVTVNSAYAEIYTSTGEKVAEATMLNDSVTVGGYEAATVAVHIHLLKSVEEISRMPRNEVLTVKTTIVYSLFGLESLVYVREEQVTVQQVVNELEKAGVM